MSRSEEAGHFVIVGSMMIRLLEDCSKVFVLQLGRGAKEELIKCSIEPVVACGIIDEVLQAYK